MQSYSSNLILCILEILYFAIHSNTLYIICICNIFVSLFISISLFQTSSQYVPVKLFLHTPFTVMIGCHSYLHILN